MAQFSVKIMRLTGSVLGENQQCGIYLAASSIAVENAEPDDLADRFRTQIVGIGEMPCAIGGVLQGHWTLAAAGLSCPSVA